MDSIAVVHGRRPLPSFQRQELMQNLKEAIKEGCEPEDIDEVIWTIESLFEEFIDWKGEEAASRWLQRQVDQFAKQPKPNC